jgi:hypothetical protein
VRLSASSQPAERAPRAAASQHAARRARTGWLEGWRLTLLLAAVIAAASVVIVLAGGASAEAIRRAIRFTARTSFVLFTSAFTASAVHRLWPGAFTRWQRRNRRYLGVGFAASHAIHAAAIATLAALQPAAFAAQTRDMATAPGLVAYGFIAAMTATSFDRTAAWLGRRWWRVLHTVGALYIWGAFAQAFVPRALRAPAYWLPAALAIGALVVRIAAWLHGRRHR